MAIRNVYKDIVGLYFKGEGLKFYIPATAGFLEGGKVVVLSVSCGLAGACATYRDFIGSKQYSTARF